MRTYKLTFGIDVRAVVPDHITQDWRNDAQSEEVTPFLKAAQDMFPDDDEGFTLHILKHGCRSMMRQSLRTLLEGTGIGGTLSPVAVLDVSHEIPE
jgi:hypothetical protein